MAEEIGNTHALRAVFVLREKILSGEFAAGVRLREVALAEELKISRTPVRDAMSRLAEEGLLERAKRGGFIIRRFTVKDVADSIELRGILEGTSARLAAERGISEAQSKKMQVILDKLDDCFDVDALKVDLKAYSELNDEFHMALNELSGSDVLQREITRVMQMPFSTPSAFLLDNQDKLEFTLSLIWAQEQHKQIMAAIEAREGARAEALTQEHAQAARKNLEETLAEDPSKLAGVARD